eukprot:CAMPEP_0178410276 /NCGR_PEP_ID=MMETSP0689_2-20121128/20895_1 /TAXON_ID=160604 /ORGANISM="Amphidinium massartii, Strain CS-259" /LENGTH=530 /DNA_ID=CAMNT_0020031445 /DNA_START=87 /DNA_END=1679 /DNA_ORIENTATION=-
MWSCGRLVLFVLLIGHICHLSLVDAAECKGANATSCSSDAEEVDASITLLQLHAKLKARRGVHQSAESHTEETLDCTSSTAASDRDRSLSLSNFGSGSLEAALRRKAAAAPKSEYLETKVREDLAAVAQATAEKHQTQVHKTEAANSQEPAKAAFLFMLMDVLENERTWEAFFEAAPRQRFSILIHQAAPTSDPMKEAPHSKLPLSKFGSRGIPRVESSWCALVGVEVALMLAALEDAENQQFILVSQNAVPLKSFQYVYNHLVVQSPRTSKACFATAANHDSAVWQFMSSEVNHECMYRDFFHRSNQLTYKHHQWVVLSREHADTFTKAADDALHVYQRTALEIVPDVRNDGCSDEVVPIAALLLHNQQMNKSSGNATRDLEDIGVEEKCLTYVSWRHCLTGTRLDVSETELTAETLESAATAMIRGEMDETWEGKDVLNAFPRDWHDEVKLEYLKTLTQEGFMFGRKFSEGIKVLVPQDGDSQNGAQRATRREDLHKMLPKLWERVDAETATKRVWKRLDAASQPAIH